MSEEEIRLDEINKVALGVNEAAHILTPQAGSRTLLIDDLWFYLYNRKRQILGLEPHTPQEWFEAER